MSRDGSAGSRVLNNPVPYVPQIIDQKPFAEKSSKRLPAQTSMPAVKVNVSKAGTSTNASQPPDDMAMSNMYLMNNSSFGGAMDQPSKRSKRSSSPDKTSNYLRNPAEEALQQQQDMQLDLID